MKFSIQTGAKPSKSDLLIVPSFEGAAPELPAGTKASSSGYKGEYKQTRQADAEGGLVERVLFVGLGKPADLDLERLRRVAAIGTKTAEQLGLSSATIHLSQALLGKIGDKVGTEAAGCSLAEGAILGVYKYTAGKSKPEPAKLKSVALHTTSKPCATGANKGKALAEANAFTRDLQNQPGNQVTPSRLAAEAQKLARASERITCKVHDEAAMKRMNMGLLLGVSAGSSEPAKLIHLTYKPKGKSKGKVAVVGKGLTFDAGGISLKPGAKMDEMRFDMSGGAAVLGLFHALTKLDVPWEVHGVVPASENLPDGAATKPGDIHTAMDGTTVEILNTDAEGRLILGDALAYTVSKIKPSTIVDLATLTGAVVVGLGHEIAGMFATTDRLRDDLRAAGDEVGEALWPLPLLDAHKQEMKGVVADLRNISSPAMGAGSSAGAAFLSHFVGDTEWAHLDIAGTAWGGSNRDWVGGSTGSGFGARMLFRWLETRG